MSLRHAIREAVEALIGYAAVLGVAALVTLVLFDVAEKVVGP